MKETIDTYSGPTARWIFAIFSLPLGVWSDVHEEHSSIIKGIKIEDRELRIALYADDTILFLTRLERSIPALLKLTDRFGKFSGYKINNTKSSILFLNTQGRHKPSIKHPFINTVNSFKYLGILITPTIDKLIHANNNPVMTKVSESLD